MVKITDEYDLQYCPKCGWENKPGHKKDDGICKVCKYKPLHVKKIKKIIQ